MGQAIPAAMYLLKTPEIAKSTQNILADLLDPGGNSKWQLKFERSDLRTDLYDAFRSHISEDLRAKAKDQGTETNWERAIYPKAARELRKNIPGIKAGKSTIRAAARRGRGKNPPL
jgi:hypothetical protein